MILAVNQPETFWEGPYRVTIEEKKQGQCRFMWRISFRAGEAFDSMRGYAKSKSDVVRDSKEALGDLKRGYCHYEV